MVAGAVPLRLVPDCGLWEGASGTSTKSDPLTPGTCETGQFGGRTVTVVVGPGSQVKWSSKTDES